ncbi:MAG TPA: phosphoribosylglycinamide formyltransferase [Gemmatimonadaceae bacterium]|nr:phosphoribosylglycinamide formyltransferase [Gemmatimonadaceae bacterium]
MRAMRSRIAVLASGGGTNLQAILGYFDAIGERRCGDVVLVASNRRDAGALERARARDIPIAVLPAPARPDAPALGALLREHEIDLVVLAGYLKLVPPDVIDTFTGRIINVHPALLPAFGGAGMYGERVHRAVLDAGVKVTGVTAHFVDREYDRGRIIAQWPVPVFPGDDVPSLAARVLRVEHLLYPRVVDAVAGGRLTLAAYAAAGEAGLLDTRPAFTLLPHDDARLAENMGIVLGA